MKCPLCEQEKGDLDEICSECLAKWEKDFPHEQEDIICSDSFVEYEESTDTLPELEEGQ